MKIQDLKQWDLFYNSNNYVCLVYKLTGRHACIINTNGTVYNAKKASDYNYNNERPNMTLEEFFMNFPVHKLESYGKNGTEQQYERIKAMYYSRGEVPRLMLLLI